MEDELLAMMLALTEAVSRKAKRGSLNKNTNTLLLYEKEERRGRLVRTS